MGTAHSAPATAERAIRGFVAVMDSCLSKVAML
jgi:hypothetical protein